MPDELSCSTDSILFKHDRIYEHSIMRVNYTTYDTRRSQDVLHVSTSHCNVVVLNHPHNGDQDSMPTHPFLYARVLGIYHANVVYVGPGRVDYQPRRMDFLWVRWYQRVASASAGWSARRLDRIRFPSVAEDSSFGFNLNGLLCKSVSLQM